MFAVNAKGNVPCIEGTDKRRGLEEYQVECVYNYIELPIMAIYGKVDNIIKICPISSECKGQSTIEEEYTRTHGPFTSKEEAEDNLLKYMENKSLERKQEYTAHEVLHEQ